MSKQRCSSDYAVRSMFDAANLLHTFVEDWQTDGGQFETPYELDKISSMLQMFREEVNDDSFDELDRLALIKDLNSIVTTLLAYKYTENRSKL